MEVPALLHGTHHQVMKNCRAHVQHILRGGAFEELDFGPYATVAEGPVDVVGNAIQKGHVEDLVLLGRGTSLRDPETHFRVYAFADALVERWPTRIDDNRLEQLYGWSFAGPVWRLAGMLGFHGDALLQRSPDLARALIERVGAAWHELDAVGPRYCSGLFHDRLGKLASNITRALGQLGASEEDLDRYAENLDVLIRLVLEGKLSSQT